MKKLTVRKLILHADDFGLTHGVNEGILLGIQKGCISATSALVNFPTSNEALQLAKQHSLDIGWHINLTLGRPLSDPKSIPSLVTSEGTFHPLNSFIIRSFWGKIKRRRSKRTFTSIRAV
ncbi:MAG: ChbG/HpnK family deacetylase [Deltaproteobacteria bacterium]|nr:MAG: ChbG/HpnK family deacetylase [Deltaproteobacteria bacterium]